MKRKICIVCHYAQEPPYNTMLRYHNWGKELVKRGNDVTIIAASTLHNTNIDVAEETGKTETECCGIRYVYIKTPRYTGNGLARIKNMLAFCFGISQHARLCEKPDVVITCEAYLYPFVRHGFKNTPIITDTVDLWPESIIEYAGFSKSNPLVRILYHLEKKAYLKSSALIFSIEGGTDYLKEQKYYNQIDMKKVFHINMGCDIEQCDKNLKNSWDNLPWDMSKRNIVYCGSVRKANQVRTLCEAAQKLPQNVMLHIYGNGDEQEELEAFVKEKAITNVRFYGRIEKSKIPFILSHSTANILTYKQVDLMKYGGSYQKMFDYFASGKPIICNARIGYNLIERYHCGIVTDDQTADSFSKAVNNLLSLSPEELEIMGKNSRMVAEMYDQPILVDKLEQVIDYVLR